MSFIKQALATVSISMDGKYWEPIVPSALPEWVDEIVMGDMLQGTICTLNEDGPFYKAERIKFTPETARSWVADYFEQHKVDICSDRYGYLMTDGIPELVSISRNIWLKGILGKLNNQDEAEIKALRSDQAKLASELIQQADRGSTPILRALQKSQIMGKRSVYAKEKKVQTRVQVRGN